MIWLAPAALVGLVGIGVPLLVHLVARRRSARLPFPTLRFIDTPPLTTRLRARLDDRALLALRMAIAGAAALALAQPAWVTEGRRASTMARRVHVAIVDSSPSMQRAGVDGQTLLTSARRHASASLDGAFAGTVVEEPDLARGLARATQWLSTAPPGAQVITIHTDAQRGALPAEADQRSLPAHVGLSVDLLIPASTSAPAYSRTVGTGADRRVETVAMTSADGTSLQVVRAPVAITCALRVSVVAAPDRQAVADAVREGVIAAGVPCAAPGSDALTIVFERGPLPRGGSPTSPASLQLAARVTEALTTSDLQRVTWVDSGTLEAHVAADPLDDVALQVVSAAFAAYGPRPDDREADPRRAPPVELASWQRPPSSPPTDAFRYEPSNDSRVVWALVLVALAVEAWARRRRASQHTVEDARAA